MKIFIKILTSICLLLWSISMAPYIKEKDKMKKISAIMIETIHIIALIGLWRFL